MHVSKNWEQEQLFQVKWGCPDTLQHWDQEAMGKPCADSTGDRQPNKGHFQEREAIHTSSLSVGKLRIGTFYGILK